MHINASLSTTFKLDENFIPIFSIFAGLELRSQQKRIVTASASRNTKSTW